MTSRKKEEAEAEAKEVEAREKKEEDEKEDEKEKEEKGEKIGRSSILFKRATRVRFRLDNQQLNPVVLCV